MLQLSLSPRYRPACVIIRIVFVIRAVVGDPLDDDFGIVTTGQGALRVGPILFGLAFLVAGNDPPSFLGLAKVSRRFGGVFVNRER